MKESFGYYRQSRAGGGNQPLLKGTDLPGKTMECLVKVKAVRESPEDWNSPLIFDLEEEVYGKSAWAPNKTSLRLMEEAGLTPESVLGVTLRLTKVLVNNPSTGAPTFGLYFDSVANKKRRVPPRPKAVPKTVVKKKSTERSDDVPF